MTHDIHAARAAAYDAHQAARARGASKDEATQEAMRAWDAIVQRGEGEEE